MTREEAIERANQLKNKYEELGILTEAEEQEAKELYRFLDGYTKAEQAKTDEDIARLRASINQSKDELDKFCDFVHRHGKIDIYRLLTDYRMQSRGE